ncbi:M-phase phosphoprotein 8 [Rhinolophus ferrumequinum]|uniref:M-phase phosphoprotein 8 n=1 Tax=Rhinolophus ferrumequinum TaxID=59479 RepID=A0A7J7ZR23_RHIFE|nr:M-phase phosphoprotein 8 [Rhinolophus ferrumequinum]
MMTPGSLRFTLKTVKKFFLNLGRRLQITKLNQLRKIFRDCP